ncbi:Clp protease N-terminal domain-containing protein [Streptomyces sp. URMC 124]|uniref:Clp protease N-terminal domain-containing protein n=1 Tax=Streptomyces sp. URMC 124 TaxID=3423405 RepID=UPI003F1D8A39
MGDTGAADVARESLFSAELAAAVAGARRRAVRDGDRQVDTAHLLHTLMESDPEVSRAVDGGSAGQGSAGQSVRLLGYLVQRTIGYGLRWSGTVEDSGSLPVLLACRAPGWSPAAAAAMEGAFARARARGAARAEGTDLLAVLALDHRCRAAEVMRRAGVDTEVLAARLDAS